MSEIIVECYADEALMRQLGYSRKLILHGPSKAGVLRSLEKNPNAVGVVDEDPGTNNSAYFLKYERIVEDKFNLEKFAKPRINTQLIVIKPFLEDWILRQAASLDVDPLNYSLPTNAKKLHSKINDQLPKFEKMQKKSKALEYLKWLIDNSH